MMIVATTIDNKKKLIPEEKFAKRYSSYALLIKDGKILLVTTKTSGKYWFPGGKVEKGEDEMVGLRREVKEEANIDIEIKEKLVDVKNYFYYEKTDEAWKAFSSFYFCNSISEKVSDINNPEKDDEAISPEWKKVDDLGESDFQDYGYEIIQLVKNKIK